MNFTVRNTVIRREVKKNSCTTYSSNLWGKGWPEAESASSSRSSWPDWPGLGEELLEAIGLQYGFDSLILFSGTLDTLIFSRRICFELWTGPFTLVAAYFESWNQFFTLNLFTRSFTILHSLGSISAFKDQPKHGPLWAMTLVKLHKIVLEGISFLPFFRTIQNGGLY